MILKSGIFANGVLSISHSPYLQRLVTSLPWSKVSMCFWRYN